jgi:hypothetical protein
VGIWLSGVSRTIQHAALFGGTVNFLMVKESERFLYVATILSQNSQL